MLKDRILELSGNPIKQLRHIAQKDEDVEDVRAFGDRLHLRVGEDKAQVVIDRLPSEIRSEGAELNSFAKHPSST